MRSRRVHPPQTSKPYAVWSAALRVTKCKVEPPLPRFSLAIVGCSGGGASIATRTTAPATPQPAGTGSLAVSITIPARASNSGKRHASYISPQTKSIAVTVGAAPPVNVNLAMGTPGCTADCTKPSINEYPLYSSYVQPRGIINGPDGKLWIVEDNGGAISHIDTDGTNYARTPNLTSSGLAQDIIVGPDNNLWVGGLYTGSITDITTTFSETILPVANQALQFTATADKTLWYSAFTASTTNTGPNIFHLDATGALIGTYPTSGNTYALTTGTDNAIWFTEDNSKVGKLTTAGVLTEFSVPKNGNAIVAGPDNAIWYADATMLNRMTYAGITTNSYPIPATTPFIFKMIVGADGALYMTDYNNNTVIRATTSGVFNTFNPPTASSGVIYATLGSDQAVWFSEQSAGNVARIGFPLTCRPTTLTVAAGQSNVTITGYNAIGGASGTGKILETNTVPLLVQPNAVNKLAVALNGVVDKVTFAIGIIAPCPGASVLTTTVQLVARDASGALIVGAEPYSDKNGNALSFTITDTDATTHTSIPAGTIITTPANTAIMTSPPTSDHQQ